MTREYCAKHEAVSCPVCCGEYDPVTVEEQVPGCVYRYRWYRDVVGQVFKDAEDTDWVAMFYTEPLERGIHDEVVSRGDLWASQHETKEAADAALRRLVRLVYG